MHNRDNPVSLPGEQTAGTDLRQVRVLEDQPCKGESRPAANFLTVESGTRDEQPFLKGINEAAAGKRL